MIFQNGRVLVVHVTMDMLLQYLLVLHSNHIHYHLVKYTLVFNKVIPYFNYDGLLSYIPYSSLVSLLLKAFLRNLFQLLTAFLFLHPYTLSVCLHQLGVRLFLNQLFICIIEPRLILGINVVSNSCKAVVIFNDKTSYSL